MTDQQDQGSPLEALTESEETKEGLVLEITDENEMISITEICRLCANQSDRLLAIFSEDGETHELASKINLYLPITVSESDELPQQCCWSCASTLLAWHELVVAAVEANKRLQSCQFVTVNKTLNVVGDYIEDCDDTKLEEGLDNNRYHHQPQTNLKEQGGDKFFTTLGNKTPEFSENDDYQFGAQSHNYLYTTPDRAMHRNEACNINESENELIELKNPNSTTTYAKNASINESEIHGKSKDLRMVEVSEKEAKDMVNLGEMKCKICEIEFPTKHETKTHMKVMHQLVITDYSKIACKVCNCEFTRKSDLMRHVKVKHAKVQRVIVSKEEIENIVDLKNNSCRLCGLSFDDRKTIRIHTENEHNVIFPERFKPARTTFVCNVCNRNFSRRYDMLKHKKTIHSNTAESKDKIEPKQECKICHEAHQQNEPNITCKSNEITEPRLESPKIHILDQQLISRTSLDLDKPETENKLNQNVSIEINQSKEDLMRFIDLNTKSCKICDADVRFKKMYELHDHMKWKHNLLYPLKFRRKQFEIDPLFFCDICKKGFTRNFDMMRHRALQHKQASPPSPKISIQKQRLELIRRCRIETNDNRFYKCDICSQTFTQSYNLVRHYTIHTGVRPYCCEICGKSFRISNSLTRHVRDVHEKIRDFECTRCQFRFTSKRNLEEHMNIHTDHRPYSCDVCGKRFKQKASLHVHQKYHSQDFKFTCMVCGKRYRRAYELKLHEYIHTGHRPHVCEECGAEFRMKPDLKRHMSVHNKSYFSCKKCLFVFSNEKKFEDHVREVHGAD